MISQPLDRRTLLKGVGAAIALPFLEGLLPRGIMAAPPNLPRPHSAWRSSMYPMA